MNLDEELRAALSLEADMQNATRPDVDGLITGGRARRRRRNVLWAGGAALAAVLIGGGAYAVTQIDRDDAGKSPIVDEPTSDASAAAVPAALPEDAGDEHLEPGTYRILVGSDASGGEIEADLTLEGPSWSGGNFPTVQEGVTYGGLGVYRPDALAAGSGCDHDVANELVREHPQALAQQLAELPGATVVQPVTSTQKLGYGAQHLRLRIADDCSAYGGYRVAETPRGSRGISYSTVPTTVVMDFWVLNLDGVPVVIDTWYQSGASTDLVDRVTRASDSISFVG
jgi:hypothetical protein